MTFPATQPDTVRRFRNWNLVFICNLVLGIWCLIAFPAIVSAQDSDIKFSLDLSVKTEPLPNIYKPGIDLSGRGFHRQLTWPQALASAEAIDSWQKDIGLSGMYRLQYDLWEINELAKDKELQDKLLGNYEAIIQKITEAGGVVILDIFGTPAGLGKVLDKKTMPLDLNAFKELIKEQIRNLSCNKRYNIWYEVWNAPDLDDFFLGRQEEYLNLYRALAEGVKELEAETNIDIPIGGPAVSWWFKNLDGNTVATPEKSLLYELIKFCSQHKLPLDFISWHTYSTDPKADNENTIYNKAAASLIRDWLSYFNFETSTPLVVDEWNYDREANVLPERSEKAHICASYIPARLKHMYEAGVNYQLYFSLEDFQDNKEGVLRNVGVFWHDAKEISYKGGTKATYNAFRMLASLGKEMFTAPKLDDEFVNVIATKTTDGLAIMVNNYIDPEIVRNYLSRNIATLNAKERKVLLKLIPQERFTRLINRQLNPSRLRVAKKIKNLLKNAQDLNEKAKKATQFNRSLKLEIKNPALVAASETPWSEPGLIEGQKDSYIYQRYSIDSRCNQDCTFAPIEEKELDFTGLYQETLDLEPYSINLIVLKKKPVQPEITPTEINETAVSQMQPLEKEDIESTEEEIPAQAENTTSGISNATITPVEPVENKDIGSQNKTKEQ